MTEWELTNLTVALNSSDGSKSFAFGELTKLISIDTILPYLLNSDCKNLSALSSSSSSIW